MDVQFVENFVANQNGKVIEFKGKGTIKQISFLAQNLYTIWSIQVDDEVEKVVNNVFCADFVTMPNSIIQVGLREFDKKKYFSVCSRIEYPFNKKFKIRVYNPQTDDLIKSLHVYYD